MPWQVQQQEYKESKALSFNLRLGPPSPHCENASWFTNHSTRGSSTTHALLTNHSQTTDISCPAPSASPVTAWLQGTSCKWQNSPWKQVKATINCGWKGWSPWRCWLIKQLETIFHYLHSPKAELDWHPSKWLPFHLFKSFTQFGFSRDKPWPLGFPQPFLLVLNKANTGTNTDVLESLESLMCSP